MTYDVLEKSAADGRPVELYTFTRGSGFVWRYTSADRDIVFETQTYTAAAINRSGIEQGPETMRNNLTLTVSRNFAIANLFRISPPTDPIALTLRQFHYEDAEAVQLWEGEIVAVSFAASTAKIVLEPAGSSLRNMGLRRCDQRNCPFVTYGPECGLNPADFRLTTTVAVVTGLALTVPAAASEADGYYDGGYLEWQVGVGTYERSFIVSHVGTGITLTQVPVGLSAGDEVRLYPGDDHTIETCNSKFNNVLNYGGMPYIPVKNPFGSDPIF